MNDQKSDFLYKVANDDYLKENLLSVILAKNPYIDISKRETFFDNVKRFYKDYKIEDRILHLELIRKDEISEISTWNNKDLRISKILVNNLRAFPKSEIPFGINFTEDDEILSYIIIGNNGVGKSSLFNALEYTFTKRIGEAELRTSDKLEDEDGYFKNYLQHYNNPYSECQFSVSTVSGNIFELDKDNIPLNIRRVLNPNNHFISEYDITTNCKLSFEKSNIDSFNYLIAKNIGLSELLEIDKNLFQFINYNRLTESNNLKKAKINFDEIQTKIKFYSEQLNFKEELVNKSQVDVSEEIRISSLKSIELVRELKSQDYSISYSYDGLRKNIIKFNEQYISLKNITSKIGNISEINFLEIGLRLLKENNDCPFCKNSKLGKKEIEKDTRKTIEEFQLYSKLSSELEKTSNIILESLNYITNAFYKLRNQIEIEAKLTSKSLISEDYNEIISSLRSTLINATSNDVVNDLENNKEKLESTAFKVSEFIRFIIERGELYFYEDLPSYITSLNYLHKKRIGIIESFEEKVNRNKDFSDKILLESVQKKEIEVLTRQIENLNKNLEVSLKEYENALEEQNFYFKVRKETTELHKVIHKEINLEISKVFEPLKAIILNVLNNYLNENINNEVELIIENETNDFDIETGEFSNRIVAYIVKKKEGDRIPVNKYFNTFHYKLFCTMVSISIAIASREKTKINLPLILDDIFYSSDFENRATIEKFIHKLFSLFKEYTPDMPLQLIMFTHDNMIFDSAIHALDITNDYKVNFAKLFHPNDATLVDNYQNIISKIPSNLPFKILSKVYA